MTSLANSIKELYKMGLTEGQLTHYAEAQGKLNELFQDAHMNGHKEFNKVPPLTDVIRDIKAEDTKVGTVQLYADGVRAIRSADATEEIIKLAELGLTEEHLKQYIDLQNAKKLDTQSNILHFTDIAGDMAELYTRKNRDYGNSFGKSLDEDGLLVAKIRLGDKYNRFTQLIKNPAEVKDESIIDTLKDMANYAIMTVMWMEDNA